MLSNLSRKASTEINMTDMTNMGVGFLIDVAAR